jgi:GNAT superfamily N-acetyltransferase
MNIRTRLAQTSDATFLAWVILTAARSHRERGWFDLVLSRPQSECLEYLRRLTLTSTRSWWHYSRFRVAEVDGRATAALCAFRAGDGYPLSQAAMVEVARSLAWSDDEQDAMWSRGAYMFTCIMESDDNLWIIENVATLPAHRGRGLAHALLEEVLAEGRAKGFTRAQIPSSSATTQPSGYMQAPGSHSTMNGAIPTSKPPSVPPVCAGSRVHCSENRPAQAPEVASREHLTAENRTSRLAVEEPREAREERAPLSQASAWSWPAARIEEQSCLMGRAEEPWTQLWTPSRRSFTVASGCTA